MAKQKTLLPIDTIWGEDGDRMSGEGGQPNPPSDSKRSTGHVRGFLKSDELNNNLYELGELAQMLISERAASYYDQVTPTQAKSQISTGLWEQDWGSVENSNNSVNSGDPNDTYRDCCIAFNTFNEPLLLALNNADSNIHVYNPRTLTFLTTSGALTDDLPSGGGETWQFYSMCTDGTSVYVFCTDTNPASDTHAVQAWDISTWDVKGGWPATGRALTGVGTRTTNAGKDIAVVDSTYLAVCNSWTAQSTSATACVELLQLSDGVIDDAGAGDMGSGYSAQTVASDGAYLYVIADNAGSVQLATLTISDLTTGSGGTGYPLAIGSNTNTKVVSCGSLIVTADGSDGAGASDIVIRVHNSSDAVLSYVLRGQNASGTPVTGDKYIYKSCTDITYDGVNVWFTSTVDNLSGGGDSVAVFKIDVGKLFPYLTDRYMNISDLTGCILATPVTESTWNPTCFDGRDLWFLTNKGALGTYSGYMHRVPLALLRS